MKVLIIGIGSIGRKHIMALRAIMPNVEIVALRHSPGAEVFEDVQNIYSFDDVNVSIFDFAIIANPTSKHKQTINELIEYRIPLFIEKPIHSSLDVEQLIEQIQSFKILTYIACNLRFLDCLIFAKEFVQNQDIRQLNEVNVYCGSYLPNWRPGTNFKQSYSAIPEMGGGVHIDLIHELDYIYWIFGSPLKTRKFFSNRSSLGIDAYDYANYLMEYRGFSVNVILNYYRRDVKRNMELVFENGTIEVDLLNNQVKKKDEILFSSSQKISDTYKPQMGYFIDCIKTEQQSMNTAKDAFNVLKICLEI